MRLWTTGALGSALGRPTFMTLPKKVLQVMFGEMAEETMLASLRVQPTRLTELGFRFKHTGIDSAIAAALAN